MMEFIHEAGFFVSLIILISIVCISCLVCNYGLSRDNKYARKIRKFYGEDTVDSIPEAYFLHFMGLLMAVCASLIWPIIIIAAIVYFSYKAFANKLYSYVDRWIDE